jgi:hypothetical protein
MGLIPKVKVCFRNRTFSLFCGYGNRTECLPLGKVFDGLSQLGPWIVCPSLVRNKLCSQGQSSTYCEAKAGLECTSGLGWHWTKYVTWPFLKTLLDLGYPEFNVEPRLAPNTLCNPGQLKTLCVTKLAFNSMYGYDCSWTDSGSGWPVLTIQSRMIMNSLYCPGCPWTHWEAHQSIELLVQPLPTLNTLCHPGWSGTWTAASYPLESKAWNTFCLVLYFQQIFYP